MVTDLHYKRKIKTNMIVGSFGLDGSSVLEWDVAAALVRNYIL